MCLCFNVCGGWMGLWSLGVIYNLGGIRQHRKKLGLDFQLHLFAQGQLCSSTMWMQIKKRGIENKLLVQFTFPYACVMWFSIKLQV